MGSINCGGRRETFRAKEVCKEWYGDWTRHTDGRIEGVAGKRHNALEERGLGGLLDEPEAPFDPPSWEDLGRQDLIGSPQRITTDHGVTYTFSPVSMAVKKTLDGLDGEFI